MRIVIIRPTMTEAKEWAGAVTDVMALSDLFTLQTIDAGKNSEGASIVLHFVANEDQADGQ